MATPQYIRDAIQAELDKVKNYAASDDEALANQIYRDWQACLEDLLRLAR
jgi:hypothetical protein